MNRAAVLPGDATHIGTPADCPLVIGIEQRTAAGCFTGQTTHGIAAGHIAVIIGNAERAAVLSDQTASIGTRTRYGGKIPHLGHSTSTAVAADQTTKVAGTGQRLGRSQVKILQRAAVKAHKTADIILAIYRAGVGNADDTAIQNGTIGADNAAHIITAGGRDGAAVAETGSCIGKDIRIGTHDTAHIIAGRNGDIACIGKILQQAARLAGHHHIIADHTTNIALRACQGKVIGLRDIPYDTAVFTDYPAYTLLAHNLACVADGGRTAVQNAACIITAVIANNAAHAFHIGSIYFAAVGNIGKACPIIQSHYATGI